MAFDRKMELYVGVFTDEAFSQSLERATERDSWHRVTLSDAGAGADQNGYLIDGLDYTFEITRSTEYMKDTATFTIFNPNDETMQKIMTAGCSVIFRAGYTDEDMGTIFVGQIATAYPENDGAETIKLVLICKSQRGAQYPLQRTYISTVIEAGRSYYDVVKIIADYVGVALTSAEGLKEYKLENDYIVNGSVQNELEEFKRRKIRKLGGNLIISNNELHYFDPRRPYFSAVYLNYGTGLISATNVRDETYQSSEDAFNENSEYYMGLKELHDFDLTNKEEMEQYKKLTEKRTVQPRNEVDFECLMNPALHVLTKVYIDARRRDDDHFSVLGEFYIKELHYNGGNFNGSDYKITGRAFENRQGEITTPD